MNERVATHRPSSFAAHTQIGRRGFDEIQANNILRDCGKSYLFLTNTEHAKQAVSMLHDLSYYQSLLNCSFTPPIRIDFVDVSKRTDALFIVSYVHN